MEATDLEVITHLDDDAHGEVQMREGQEQSQEVQNGLGPEL